MDLLQETAQAIWLLLPAYIANMAPLFINSKHPIDGGRKYKDGKPIFGPGKTWEGLLFGAGIGGLTGFFQGAVQAAYSIGGGFTSMTPKLGLAIGLGALLGDITKSFFKRRAGYKRGQHAFPIDQVDFIIGGFIAASLLVNIKLSWIVILLVITPLLHRITNIIAFKSHKKEEPW